MYNNKDYYKILNIDKNADTQSIKRAYRKLAMKYHPDVNKQRDAEEKFKDLTEAYAVLSDEEKRKQYDSYGYRSMNKYTQDELIKSVNMDNIFKGVKFVADLERNYGLVSGLIGIGLTGRTTSKTLRLAGKLLKGKSMLDTVTGHKHRNRHRNKSINKD
ncbi:MAG: hypothetical protein E7Z86_03560 [Methanosphaera stadtmanae]|jgi:molecular chaperone DnaJ|nr:hypothetical protein [Methanosphaera stadtmanae]